MKTAILLFPALVLALSSAQGITDATACKSIKDAEKQARRLKKQILRAESCYKADGTTYYVSGKGDDSNDGKSPETPFKTLEKINSMELHNGDAVLLRRGDLWRGCLETCEGVSYSAYGKGHKPRLYGSPFDAAKTGEWKETQTPDVYVLGIPVKDDVGTLVFNNGKKGCAFKVMKKTYPDGHTVHIDTEEPFNGYGDLCRDLDFYHDPLTGLVYLCSRKGNPARRFKSIEMNPAQHGIMARDGVSIDNLCIKYVGCHGVACVFCRNVSVTNCEIGWIGGSIQFDNPIREDRPVHPTRFGNGVEVWGSCDNFNVSHNYVYQVYDAGITHQFTGDSNLEPFNEDNITYCDNLVEKCVYAIEYFLDASRPGLEDRSMNHVLFEGNILRMSGGYGWGIQRPDRKGPCLIKASGSHLNKSSDFKIVNNIFDRGNPSLLEVGAKRPEWMPRCSGNVFFQREGDKVGTPIEQNTEIIFIK